MPLCLTEEFRGRGGVGTGGVETSHRCRLERSSGGSAWGRGCGALGLALGLEMFGLGLAGGGTSTESAEVVSDTWNSAGCKVSALTGSTVGLVLVRGAKKGWALPLGMAAAGCTKDVPGMVSGPAWSKVGLWSGWRGSSAG